MAKAPVMPLWTDALIGDTTHLSAEQFGCYLLILIATWRNNGKALPDDDERMAHVCRVSRYKWKNFLRKTLAEFFEVNHSGWHQQRLEKEWNRVSRWLSQQAAKGAAGGKQTSSRGLSRKAATHKPLYKNPSSSSLPASARACVPAEAAAHAHDTATPAIAQSQEINGHASWKPIGVALGHPAPPPPAASEENRRAERQQQHMAFLNAHGNAGDLALYLAAQMSDDPDAAQRMFDLTDARMRDDRREGAAA
jgi:uncharacterized protein YdaU (DUF1376 family)